MMAKRDQKWKTDPSRVQGSPNERASKILGTKSMGRRDPDPIPFYTTSEIACFVLPRLVGGRAFRLVGNWVMNYDNCSGTSPMGTVVGWGSVPLCPTSGDRTIACQPRGMSGSIPATWWS
uniref:Uncharacterized protein n=1 Tax=Bionectria ochroleuca TaxID=29856 RepID=A0A8H7KDM7_BIOOC